MAVSQVYTPASLAKHWGCSERLVRNLIQGGKLRAFRLGEKLHRIPADAAEEYMRCQSTALPGLGENGQLQSGSMGSAPTDIRLARQIGKQQNNA